MNIRIKHKRHLLKTFTWRMVATTFTILVVWLFTGNIEFSLGIGAVEFFGKMILYYIHERVWYKSDIGILNIKNRTHDD